MPKTGWRDVIFVVSIVIFLVSSLIIGGGTAAATAQSTESAPDTTIIRADVSPDGTATVSVTYRFQLNTQNETDAFNQLSQSIESNRSAYETAFENRLTTTMRTAENQTGREMSLQNISVSATTEEFPQEYGVVTYTADWTNFAAVNDTQIAMGDSVSGFFLDDQTRLVLTWSEEYQLDSITPSPATHEPGKAVWTGPQQFSDDEPRLTVSQSPTSGPSDPDTDGLPVMPLLGAGLILGIGVGGYLYYRTDDSADTTTGNDDGSDSTSPTQSTDNAELMSDKEQVLTLLEEEGGRMKQQNLVSVYDWSESKTSRVVNNLDDQDVINVYRIGRENVIMDPEQDDFTE